MDSEKLDRIRHSLAHLLAMAAREKDPKVKLAIGPTIDNGFYYDFEFSEDVNITQEDLGVFEARMKDLVKEDLPFEGRKVVAAEARELFKGQPYKLELIDELEKAGEKITVYTSGGFTDLCRGGHVKNTREIDPESFALTHTAGAYWRGDEKNKMLTRIYGFAFGSKEELEKYELQVEEAKKRDHRKLGRELDLFTYSDLIGPGLPLWTPKGTILRDLLDDYVWQLRAAAGYSRVDIPHIAKKDLYEKSGHWTKFQTELFRITTREGHELAIKPMNCPHHVQIYARKPWSYRELPERYASTTKVYRDEQTGELAGLTRVRAITQDDAHVFCRSSQVKEEISKIWDIVLKFYGNFNFSLTPRLSLHDPKNMTAYLGAEEIWQKAESALRELVAEKGVKAVEAVGDAAFYGPKIDFLGKDSLGRNHQVATIQLDMNMPERFDLNCVNEKSEAERIVMIHAAIMGSIERFLSVIIEHYGGAFPVWLSPVQVAVLPIGEKHREYAGEVFSILKNAGIRAELNDNDESLGKKIRNAKTQKIPYLLVLGDKEMAYKTVTVESRDRGQIGAQKLEEFLSSIKTEIADKK